MCLFYTEAPGLSKVPSSKTQSCAQVPDAKISAQLGTVLLVAPPRPSPPSPIWKITHCGFLVSTVSRLHRFRSPPPLCTESPSPQELTSFCNSELPPAPLALRPPLKTKQTTPSGILAGWFAQCLSVSVSRDSHPDCSKWLRGRGVSAVVL